MVIYGWPIGIHRLSMVSYYCFPLLPEQFDPCPSDTTNGGPEMMVIPTSKSFSLAKYVKR